MAPAFEVSGSESFFFFFPKNAAQVRSQLALPQRLISSPAHEAASQLPNHDINLFFFTDSLLSRLNRCDGQVSELEGELQLTRVCHELEGSAKVAVARCRAGAHVEDIGGERSETLDVGASGRRLDDPVASLVLVLRWTTSGRKLS